MGKVDSIISVMDGTLEIRSSFPFSCYKAMTDPAKRLWLLLPLRCQKTKTLSLLNFRTESWMHSASFISPSQIPYDSFQKLSIAMLCELLVQQMVLHTHTYSTILVFILPPALQWPSNASISFPQILGQKKSFESPLQMSMDGPSPTHKKKSGRESNVLYIHRFVCVHF